MSTRPGASLSADTVTAKPSPTAPELWRRYHQGQDLNTENALVEKYLPLVAAVVGRVAMNLPEWVDQNDLYSAGLIGLLQALRNYDPGCGATFETYARMRVRGAMFDELRRMDWVPRSVHDKARKIQNVMSELEQRLGAAPTEEQMAKALKMPLSEYNNLLNEVRPAAFVCLDSVSASENEDGGDLYEVIMDPGVEGPMEKVSQHELKRLVYDRLKDLPDMQRKVMALYYGEDLHLREIAEVFGLTESRISQIHTQAIISIRAYLQRFEAGLAKQTANA